jgi:hypothetical protein
MSVFSLFEEPVRAQRCEPSPTHRTEAKKGRSTYDRWTPGYSFWTIVRREEPAGQSSRQVLSGAAKKVGKIKMGQATFSFHLIALSHLPGSAPWTHSTFSPNRLAIFVCQSVSPKGLWRSLTHELKPAGALVMVRRPALSSLPRLPLDRDRLTGSNANLTMANHLPTRGKVACPL